MGKVVLDIEPGKGYITYMVSEDTYISLGFSDLENKLDTTVEGIRRAVKSETNEQIENR